LASNGELFAGAGTKGTSPTGGSTTGGRQYGKQSIRQALAGSGDPAAGLWFFITPWVFGYPIPSIQAWTAFISGAVVALLAAFDLYKTYFWAVVLNLLVGVWVACRHGCCGLPITAS
jgi:hypothetical protein